MKILLLALFLSCVGGCRVPMNTKPAWARGPEARSDTRAIVAADIPSEIDLAPRAGRGQSAPFPSTKSSEIVSGANAYAALELPTLLSR